MMDALAGLYAGFTGWSVPWVVRGTVLGFSLVTSALLTTFTAGSRMFTMPIAFVILYIFGLIGNYAGRNIVFAGTSDMQKAIVLAAIGQMVGGFILLLLLKTGSGQRGRG
jgi:hypothetical protein